MSSTEKNSDRIAKLERLVREQSSRIHSLETALSRTHDQTRKQAWVRITGTSGSTGFTAVSLDVHDRNSTETLVNRSATDNLIVFAVDQHRPNVGDVVMVERMERIWTIVNPGRNGSLYFQHRQEDGTNAFILPWRDPSSIGSGQSIYSNLMAFQWSNIGSNVRTFDTDAFELSPTSGDIRLKPNFNPPSSTLVHIHWTGMFHHGMRSPEVSNPTQIAESKIAFAIIKGDDQTVVDSKMYIRPPWIFDDAIAQAVHYQFSGGSILSQFQYQMQLWEPIPFSLQAAVPYSELSNRLVFSIQAADVSPTAPGSNMGNTAVITQPSFGGTVRTNTLRIFTT